MIDRKLSQAEIEDLIDFVVGIAVSCGPEDTPLAQDLLRRLRISDWDSEFDSDSLEGGGAS